MLEVVLLTTAICVPLFFVAWVIFDHQFIFAVIRDFFESIKMKFIK